MYRYLIEMFGVNFKIVIQVFVWNKILCFLIVSKAVLEIDTKDNGCHFIFLFFIIGNEHCQFLDLGIFDLITGGTVDKIECVTVDGDIPSYSSGEMLTCYPDSGLVCRNADNFPVDCQDYKIRYHCQCGESPSLSVSISLLLFLFLSLSFSEDFLDIVKLFSLICYISDNFILKISIYCFLLLAVIFRLLVF